MLLVADIIGAWIWCGSLAATPIRGVSLEAWHVPAAHVAVEVVALAVRLARKLHLIRWGAFKLIDVSG